ncbi:alpha/beta hydrolase [Pelomonas sp. KK5]|uniref:alpha/beta hydrolase n=1 Tax=Pelomonas sp. KK5 TaxID=1855730 RepID=UPI0009F99906|nr:alpha/beta hydrolase [Pelomonas sp. KK5]
MTTLNSVPPEIAARLAELGSGFNLPQVQALYEPLLARQPTEGVLRTESRPYGDDERQVLDVYQPASPATSPRPLLLFFHGGGFIRGDKAHKANIGWHLARHGVVALLPNYRLAPAHRWPAGPQDVAAALTWAREQAPALGADPGRIFLMGESAGAAHVAAACLMSRFGVHGVRGAVLCSGPYNARLERLSREALNIATPDPRNDAYFGTDDPEALAAMSTALQVDVAPFPLLITHAERDLLQMQVQAGELFSRLAGQHGFTPELRCIRHHNHFSQTQAVNTGDESLSGPVLDFLARHGA